jgi:hypothetical protein
MAFSKTTIEAAFSRAHGRCECTRCHLGIYDAPHHGKRCTNTFSIGDNWSAHHRYPGAMGGYDSLLNCEILCPECAKLAETYGIDSILDAI